MHLDSRIIYSEEYKRDAGFRNVVQMAIGFGFIYFGTDSGVQIMIVGLRTTQSYTVPLLGNLGSLSLSIAYFGYAFANLFVPSMVSAFKNERLAMAFASMEYPYCAVNWIYGTAFIHTSSFTLFRGCVLSGRLFTDSLPLSSGHAKVCICLRIPPMKTEVVVRVFSGVST